MRLTKLLARLVAKLVDPKAPPAKLLAWLNLSHRENASVLMIVRANAIARYYISILGKAKEKMGLDSPTRGSHKNCSRIIARIAINIHHSG